jgi:hypothetical protein
LHICLKKGHLCKGDIIKKKTAPPAEEITEDEGRALNYLIDMGKEDAVNEINEYIRTHPDLTTAAAYYNYLTEIRGMTINEIVNATGRDGSAIRKALKRLP